MACFPSGAYLVVKLRVKVLLRYGQNHTIFKLKLTKLIRRKIQNLMNHHSQGNPIQDVELYLTGDVWADEARNRRHYLSQDDEDPDFVHEPRVYWEFNEDTDSEDETYFPTP